MSYFTGGCLCGNVRLTATGQPDRVGICHCLDCRKFHGALFHASAVFAQDAVTVTGQTDEYQGRFFCPRCGSSVFSRTGNEIEVNLGIAGCPRPAPADLRAMGHSPGSLAAGISPCRAA